MPCRLVWAADARRDLRETINFVASLNAAAASRLEAAILGCAERARQFPLAHRSGRVEGTRGTVAHPNYVLVYSVLEDRVRILRVLHARRLYP